MNPLLSVLVAILAFTVPTQADTQRFDGSVRVVDHQGNPISGLWLTLRWQNNSVDPLMNDRSGPRGPGFVVYSSSTDEQGVASFRFRDEFELAPEAGVLIVPSFHQMTSTPGDFATATATHDPEDAAHLEPRHRRSVEQKIERHLRDSRLRATHAFKPHYQFKGQELLHRSATIRVPEAIWCEVRLPGQRSALPSRPTSIHVRDALPWPIDERAETIHVPIENGERVDIGVLRYAQSHAASNNTVLCYLHSFDAFASDSGMVLGSRFALHEPEFNATLHYRPGVWRADFSCGAIVRSDGEFAFLADLLRSSASLEDGYRMQVAAGEYVVVRNAIPQTALGPDHWHDGSVFDTMLRLRRGEELPHLKRITIPEGGTVELSSEDFLDPPAEPEAKDETP